MSTRPRRGALQLSVFLHLLVAVVLATAEVQPPRYSFQMTSVYAISSDAARHLEPLYLPSSATANPGSPAPAGDTSSAAGPATHQPRTADAVGVTPTEIPSEFRSLVTEEVSMASPFLSGEARRAQVLLFGGDLNPGIPVPAAPLPPPEPAPLSSAPAAAELPLRIGGRVSPAVPIEKKDPDYPPAALVGRVEGVVVVAARIRTNGSVEALRVIDGHPLLRAAAIEAVSQWRYRPTTLNGQPIASDVTVHVTFALER